jgi:hypothetical protein
MKKIVLLSLVVIGCILFSDQLKRGFFSLLILADIAQPPGNTIMGKLFDGPLVKQVAIPGKGRVIIADLYIPQGKKKSFPVLLVHSADQSGKNDERLTRLAKDLSRTGFLVLVPDLEGMKTFRMRIADAEDILQSYQYLIGHEHAAVRSGGMIGMNFGAGPMLLAAADPRIRDNVRVLAAFGGYYDLRSVLNFGLTGVYEYAGHHGLIRPDTSVRWMLAYRNLDLLLRSPDDRSVFRKIIEKRNRYEIAEADALAASLRAEGKALFTFVMNSDPEQFSPLYESLAHPFREYVYQLSPARAIKYIAAYCIFIHATDDYSVPYTESMRFIDARSDSRRTYLALLPYFLHGGSGETSAGDWFKRYLLGGWRLFAAIYTFLEKTDDFTP